MKKKRTLYQDFIHLSHYSRWVRDVGRRETWEETVERYFQFFEHHLRENRNYTLSNADKLKLKNAVLNHDIMPSMRCMATAGKALEKDNAAAYNCAFCAIDNPRSFDEILYLLACGVGVGFSIERQYVSQLPIIAENFYETETTIIVKDSRIGWAKALKELIGLLYQGQIPKWDVSKVRAAGSPLKTFGGRASGPDPLVDLFNFCIKSFCNASGRKLQSIECYDIVCKIAETIIVGGVRRCRPFFTFIHCQNGLKRISDIEVGDYVLSQGGGYQKVVAKQNVGEKKTIVIHSQLGKIIVTPEHRLAVFTNPLKETFIWKEAKELTTQDQLMFCERLVEGEQTTIPNYNTKLPRHNLNTKTINIHALSTTEWAWLIGYLHGDGCVYRTLKSVSFVVSCDMPQTYNRIHSYLLRLGANPLTTHPSDKCRCIRVNSVQLAHYLSQFKQPYTPLIIPPFVLCGTPVIRYAYLGGIIDSDGTTKSSSPQGKRFVVVTTTYESYAYQIRCLLASLGIPSCYKIRHAKKKTWRSRCDVRIIGGRFKDVLARAIFNQSEKIRMDYNFCVLNTDRKSFTIANENKLRPKHRGSHVQWESVRSELMSYLPIRIDSVEEGQCVECYDIQVEGDESFIAEGIVNHNSALLSLSNLSDERMRNAKSGQWWIENGQRALSNNSVCYTEKPDVNIFLAEWKSLYESRSGERGIFNLQAARASSEKSGRRIVEKIGGVNPCGEVLLRNRSFCNLSEVIIRPTDNITSITEKVRLATILGTFQSSLSNFRYLSKEWKNNVEEERLLGVSLTGIYDNDYMSKPSEALKRDLTRLQTIAIQTNKKWAKKLNISAATAITTIKPSGTISQLCDTSSGIHPRYAPYYIRRVRLDNKDPLSKMMKDLGFPHEVDVTQPLNIDIFLFPIKSPLVNIHRNTLSALEHLKLWSFYKEHWAEHTVSITVSIREDEWLDVAAYVYRYFDNISGVSFLPYSDHVYTQAPYQECSEQEYNELLMKLPSTVDWTKLADYEESDMTTSAHEIACVSGKCEI